MSSDDAPTKTISDFEATLAKADTAVASFCLLYTSDAADDM
jgi:hypothetical protein